MRNRLIAILGTLAILAGVSWFSVVHAQTSQMARHEPHMSAALGHLQQAKAELDRAVPNKGGHRERAMQLVDQAIQQVEEGEKYYDEHPPR